MIIRNVERDYPIIGQIKGHKKNRHEDHKLFIGNCLKEHLFLNVFMHSKSVSFNIKPQVLVHASFFPKKTTEEPLNAL